MHLDETAIPVHPPVRAVCNMLGYDPLYLACEGRIVAVLSAEDAPRALDAWRAMPSGEEAAIIGDPVAQRSQTACWMTMRGKRGRRYETFPELGSL